jgi:signal transduction histidine kinase
MPRPARRKTNGLGMSITSLLVALHYSYIAFESAGGQSTTFTITLLYPLA